MVFAVIVFAVVVLAVVVLSVVVFAVMVIVIAKVSPGPQNVQPCHDLPFPVSALNGTELAIH